MKLKYRGVSYDSSPNSTLLKIGPVLAKGLYRGLSVMFRRAENVPEMPSYELKWRGATYHSGRPTPITSPVPVPATVPIPATVPVFEAAPVMAPAAPIALGAVPEVVPTPAVEAAVPTMSINDRSRNLFIQRHKSMRRREQDMMVRLAEKIGLPIEQVTGYESQIQGKIPHDFGGYESSHRAMS
ncbi:MULTISPECIES: DUF4278 domain-containing protein [unclassified Leptolyngbya]|uniref:DUF4278 domain-containing protein n=1 Tax=unclassified Leptolyngbya TaxID=2650499 RepID=UPI001683A3D4|nr:MULTISPECIES: DUF4278 domain-containing protein [unclassified Leptolyngbya]MBD1912335.1 DUF4278 domain-containing protein [Leptolyngbya sp. FACHB-8]MBD2158029.1 DUF4278 domain-containing protein [Leptolyngbya sp. FACHB-16]